jgi:putative membrane protein
MPSEGEPGQEAEVPSPVEAPPPAPAEDPFATSRRLHPATLLFSTLRFARGFLIPAVILALTGGGGAGDTAQRLALFLGIPALIFATARYLSFRYRLAGDELVIDSGVLRRNRRVIPLGRVQNIDTRRSALQRLLGVAELRLETASIDDVEASLEVLRLGDAEQLRAELLRRRRGGLPTGVAGDVREDVPEEVRLLARLSPGDLTLAGATANRAGLIAVGIAGALQLLGQVPVELWPAVRLDYETLAYRLPVTQLVLALLGLALAVVLIGWLISITTTVVGYHGFTLERVGQDLRKRFGLLGRREATVPLRRVQAVRVEETLLRRRFGLAALKIETAGNQIGAPQAGGAEAFLPLARQREVPGLVSAVFPEADYGALRFRGVHPRARRRAFVRYSILPLLAGAVLYGFFGPVALWALAALPLTFLAAHLHYRNLGWARAPGFVATREGFLNRITWVVPEEKIQTLHTHATPFQRRHRLATLVVDTAAGGGQARVLDLHRARAARMLQDLGVSAVAARRRNRAARSRR